MKRPKISVIIGVLNAKDSLDTAIKSLLAQNYSPLELIIIDGGSTDGTLEIIKIYQPFIYYWQSSKDDGHCDACNKGIKHATGELINFLNADDKLEEGALQKVAAVYIANPTVEVITGGAQIIKKSTRNVIKLITDPKQLSITLENILFNLPVINARFFSKNIFLKYGGFQPKFHDASYYLSNDREFMARLALNKVDTLVIPESLYTCFAHENSMTFNHKNKIKIHTEHLWLANQLLSRIDLTEEQKKLITHWGMRETTVLFYLLLLNKNYNKAYGLFLIGWGSNKNLLARNLCALPCKVIFNKVTNFFGLGYSR